MSTLSHDPSHLPRSLIDLMIDEHHASALPRRRRLWRYYRNPLLTLSRDTQLGRAYRLAQAEGLPKRLRPAASEDPAGHTPEIVIENDIAWRIHTLVDFMFGRPFVLQSLAPATDRAATIQRFLQQVFAHNGGISFFQDLSLLGAVYGHVDILLRPTLSPTHLSQSASTPNARSRAAGAATRRQQDARGDAGTTRAKGAISPDNAHHAAARIGLELINAEHAIPVLNRGDYRRIDAYILHQPQETRQTTTPSLLQRVSRRIAGRSGAETRVTQWRTEVWTPQRVQCFIGDEKRREAVSNFTNRFGCIPLVHIQNLPQPFAYEGLSDVEPLIPLQDELNTRLSDRANRVTFQSFKMYLGKGIEHFTQRPVAPGQMWATDNAEAQIIEFGGDAASPSEEAHINEIREAMDKTSGVTPIAAGLLRNKVGNLTSENALRIVLMGLLNKTEKKRVTYGAGIAALCRLILHMADVTRIFPNSPDEREVRIDWPSALPENESQQLQNAQLKAALGVPRKQVLAELGYEDVEPRDDVRREPRP